MAKIWQVILMIKITKLRKSQIKKFILRLITSLSIVLLIIITGVSSYLILYDGKIYPNTSVVGIKVAGKTPSEATSIISSKVSIPSDISLVYQDQTFKINASDINLSYDFEKSATNAYKYTRAGNIFNDIRSRVGILFQPKNIGLVVNTDKDALSKILSIISGQISIDSVSPSASIVNGSIVIARGEAGKEVNQEELTAKIIDSLSFNLGGQIEIPAEIVDNTLSDIEAASFALRAEKYLGKSLSLKFEYNNVVLKDADIIKLLDPKSGYNDSEISATTQKIAKLIEREPQNSKFVFENGRVTEFQPALDGIKIDSAGLKRLISQDLEELVNGDVKNIDLDIPTIKSLPEITISQVNNLGIKELIGRGTSTYFHSIPGRVYNVSLAASRINGTLVKPGEVFSFNNVLGDVSAFTGYQQAYIISEGKTILGDGGGVCQVSTTLFRALLDAGLPINERQAHAYRVGYYEQGSPPGIDATVYSPSPDLKFTNDTSNYILIEAMADPKNYSLIFELYGTSDGRVSTISKPVVTNVSAPPEDLYQDDPSLPAGTIKQIDFKAWGAKVTFKYTVRKNGQEIYNKTFVSNYKPWQAIYLRGTGPAN